jgi:hypothetical protein
LVQNVKGTQPLAVKKKVLEILEHLTIHMNEYELNLHSLRRDISSISKAAESIERAVEGKTESIEEPIKETIKETIRETPMTWSEIVSADKLGDDKLAVKREERRIAREKARQERAKYEVILTTATAPEIASLSNKEITEHLQQAVDSNIHHNDKRKLYGISKTGHSHIHIRCKSEDEAQTLRNINWESASKGLSVYKPKYGIVIHAVPKFEFNAVIDTNNPMIERLERENSIPITKIAPLRRKEKENAAHHSIVVFTTDPYATDRRIKHGFYINYLHFPHHNYKSFKATTAANMAIELPNANKSNDVGNAEKGLIPPMNAQAVYSNAPTAMENMKSGAASAQDGLPNLEDSMSKRDRHHPTSPPNFG